MLTQGGQRGRRPPWPRDSIAFQPTFHCISTRPDGSYLPLDPLADRELSPQARMLSGWRYELLGENMLLFLTSQVSLRLDVRAGALTTVFERVPSPA
jgi:hypothetical protein